MKIVVGVLVSLSFLAMVGLVVVTIAGFFGYSALFGGWIDWAWLCNYQTLICGTVASFLLVTTAIIALWQLIAMQRTSYAQLLMSLVETWDSKDYIDARWMIRKSCRVPDQQVANLLKETMLTYHESNIRDFYIMQRVPNFFENLGFLAHANYLPRQDAMRLFKSPSRAYYERFSEFIKEQRRLKQPSAWVYFEYLATEFRKKPETKDVKN